MKPGLLLLLAVTASAAEPVRDREIKKMQEDLARLDRDLAQMAAALEKQIAKETAAGQHRVRGKVISSYPEGLLVECAKRDDNGIAGRVLLTGLKDPKPPVVDGTPINGIVKQNGTFQYRAIDAGTHTIPKVEYISPFPKLSPPPAK